MSYLMIELDGLVCSLCRTAWNEKNPSKLFFTYLCFLFYRALPTKLQSTDMPFFAFPLRIEVDKGDRRPMTKLLGM